VQGMNNDTSFFIKLLLFGEERLNEWLKLNKKKRRRSRVKKILPAPSFSPNLRSLIQIS
jgi:hypothetical protein